MKDRSSLTLSTGSFYQLMIIKYYNTETLLYSLIIFVSDIERSLKIVFLSIIRQTEAIRAEGYKSVNDFLFFTFLKRRDWSIFLDQISVKW